MLTAHLAELIGALNAFIAGFRHDSVQIAVLKHLHALNGGAAGRAHRADQLCWRLIAAQQHFGRADHGLTDERQRVFLVDTMLLRTLHERVRVGIQVRRSRTGIRNDLVEHVLLLKCDGNAHGVEEFTEFGQLLVGCGRILNQLGCTLAEHKRRVRHHADHCGVRAERTLQLGEGHACGNGYDKRLLPFIFRQIRQDFVEILRLDSP